MAVELPWRYNVIKPNTAPGGHLLQLATSCLGWLEKIRLWLHGKLARIRLACYMLHVCRLHPRTLHTETPPQLLELSMWHREISQCPQKAPTRALNLLKAKQMVKYSK